MTTTEHLRTGPDYYLTQEECNRHKFNMKQSNSRYPNYTQTHFTAGDEEQFEKFRNKTILKPFISGHNNIWHKYCNLTPQSVSNTFKYIFHKFKKGIFIQIKDNKLSVMLPFSKRNYINEWSHLITYDKNIFKRVCDLDGRVFKEKKINTFKENWYGNNALVRYEYPIRENDSGVAVINDMFLELCNTFPDIPDIEFFVNKRDYAIMRKDEYESYTFIFGNTSLVSHKYPTYSPILSMCGSKDHADILIPTWDDWSSVCETKFFPKCPVKKTNFFQEWDKKIPTAIFRGSSTGFGLTFDTNMRLKVSLMSIDNICDNDIPLIDAGITSWNVRPRINKDTHCLETFTDDIMNMLPLVQFKSLDEQSRYKYIINIDGHVSAYRLSSEMGSGSVILLVMSNNKLWFTDMLIPYVHYVPVLEDLSDLYSQIIWCKNHDTECKIIAENAKKFRDTYLSKTGILTFLRDTLTQLKIAGGTYVYKKSPIERQLYEKIRLLENYSTPTDLPKFTNKNVSLPLYNRTFDLLQGIQWMFYSIHNIQLPSVKQIKFNKKTNLNVYDLDTVKILEKISDREIINDGVMGLYCINPLLKYIPNFSYTFYSSKDAIFTEYFDECPTLFEYISSVNFNMQEYLKIMLQIALAIHTAQQHCFFIHYDLYPWNIVLKSSPPIDVYYLVNSEYIKITTTLIPIIIDYGKSRGIINGIYYGTLDPYSNSTIHDILCILISSMFNIINKHTLSKTDLGIVFKLSEFFSGTTYTDNKIFTTIRELKQFLSSHKKYAQMLDFPKYELEKKNPMDFVKFLRCRLNCSYTTVQAPVLNMRSTTGRLVYNYMNASTEKGRRDACTETIDRIKNYKGTVVDGIFKNIIKSIRLLHTNVYVEDIVIKQNIETFKDISPVDYTTTSYDMNVFDDDDKCKILQDQFYNSIEYPENIIETKHFILDYLTPLDYKNITSIDNIKMLTVVANRKTFNLLYNK
jgi:hypothetical protein